MRWQLGVKERTDHARGGCALAHFRFTNLELRIKKNPINPFYRVNPVNKMSGLKRLLFSNLENQIRSLH